jgi:hypothetical protein
VSPVVKRRESARVERPIMESMFRPDARFSAGVVADGVRSGRPARWRRDGAGPDGPIGRCRRRVSGLYSNPGGLLICPGSVRPGRAIAGDGSSAPGPEPRTGRTGPDFPPATCKRLYPCPIVCSRWPFPPERAVRERSA